MKKFVRQVLELTFHWPTNVKEENKKAWMNGTLKGLYVVSLQLGNSLKGKNDASERKDIKNFHFLHRTSLSTKVELIVFDKIYHG